MASQPQCPFCLKVFETVEQVTQHLIFENCEVQAPRPAEKEADASEEAPVSSPEKADDIVLQS